MSKREVTPEQSRIIAEILDTTKELANKLGIVVGTPRDAPNQLEIAFQNGNVTAINCKEEHQRDLIRGIKGSPITIFPVSYPIVDTDGNFLCMSDDYWAKFMAGPAADVVVGGLTRQSVRAALALMKGQEPDAPEADTPYVVEG